MCDAFHDLLVILPRSYLYRKSTSTKKKKGKERKSKNIAKYFLSSSLFKRKWRGDISHPNVSLKILMPLTQDLFMNDI